MRKACDRIVSAVLVSSLGAASILVCIGCIVMVPTPRHVPLDSRTRGPIDAKELRFLKVGQTTQEEVVLKLGEPDQALKAGKEFVYSWTSITGRWGVGAGYGVAVELGKLGERTIYLRIYFDEEGLISRLSGSRFSDPEPTRSAEDKPPSPPHDL